MKLILALLAIVSINLTALTQVRVSGIVVDGRNRPMSGATVFEKGTYNGTFTDEEGKFSIETASDEPIIVVEYVGFTTVEVTPTDYSNIKVVLKRKLLNGGGPYVGINIPNRDSLGVGLGINIGANIPIQKIQTVLDFRSSYFWLNKTCWLSFSGGLYKEFYDRYSVHLNLGPQFKGVNFSESQLHITPELSMRLYILKKLDLRVAYGFRWVPSDRESNLFQVRLTNTFN